MPNWMSRSWNGGTAARVFCGSDGAANRSFSSFRRTTRLLQIGKSEAVKEAVKAGLGVSLVLRSAVAEEVRNGSLRAIPIQRPALEKDLFVIWRDTGVSHISAPAFVTHLMGDGWKTPE